MKKIVIASDSFKGSLSSSEVAAAAAKGVRDIYPDCIVEEIAVADGGEGWLDIFRHTTDNQCITSIVHNPLNRLIEASYIVKDNIAIIETAKANGLTLLKSAERNPLKTSTYGSGELILDAYSRGCRKFLIGLGGSATNDGGTGMLEALGFRFFDIEGKEIRGCCGEKLKMIASIDSSHKKIDTHACEFLVACDVDSPFVGPEGATKIFAGQKGASLQMREELETGMRSFCEIIHKSTGIDLAATPGSGAAGGLGGAFFAFLNGKLNSGIEIILDEICFDPRISGADLIITGEGKIDSQTVKGKVPYGILKRAQKYGIPTILIAGIVDLPMEGSKYSGFKDILPIQPRPTTETELSEAMTNEVASARIRQTIAEYLKKYQKNLVDSK